MKIFKIKGYGNELGLKLEHPIIVGSHSDPGGFAAEKNTKYEIALIGWFGTYSHVNLPIDYQVVINNTEKTIKAGVYTLDTLNHALTPAAISVGGADGDSSTRDSPLGSKGGNELSKKKGGSERVGECTGEQGCMVNIPKALAEKNGYIAANFPTHMKLGELAKVLGFDRQKFAPNNVYLANNKHNLFKNNYNCIEIHCNICEPSMQTFNENFRTHEGIEILYVCNPNLKEGEKFSESPSPPMFIPLKEDFTKIKHIAISIKNEKGQALDLSKTYNNIYLALREKHEK
jgi:hypothetical protein